mmetsp:Transcript_7377/g.9152  ORF Transcript_7377/g.9152 Transcript_7377/m.9152 type:complete len:558 (+) Transcript_7377:663-2336(+)
MGQCSNLPADGNKDNNNSNNNNSSNNSTSERSVNSHNNAMNSPRGQRNGKFNGRRPSSREQRDSSYHSSGRSANHDDHRQYDGDVVMDGAGASGADVNKLVHIAKQGNQKFDQFMNGNDNGDTSATTSLSPRKGSSRSRPTSGGSHSHHNYNHPPIEEAPLPPPPSGAVRTRCYRLNLDAPVILSPTHDHLGPMPYEPPAHLLPQYSHISTNSSNVNNNNNGKIKKTYSSESAEQSPTQVAISTARIFRGITVDKNGIILSQNARATRSSRGKEKSKQAAGSRQQEKINKAKDLVDETNGSGGGKENDKDKSNMVSLVIVGEYDEMKQLVRDGAKKLRDADGLPDEALLSINRPRQHGHGSRRSADQISQAGGSGGIGMNHVNSSSSRKRFPSPSHVQSLPESPDNRTRSRNRMGGGNNGSSSGNMSQNILSGVPPKLKGHPRDRPTSRRMASGGGNSSSDGNKCHDMSIFGGGDSDWSDALGFSKGFDSIWNCGATGKDAGTSPSNGSKKKPTSAGGRSSGSRSSRVRNEGRNESSARFSRGGERDAPVSKDVMIL